MMCKVCQPGEMLCEACFSEEEDPPTVRIPKTTYAFAKTFFGPYRPIVSNPPAIRPILIPIYEIAE